LPLAIFVLAAAVRLAVLFSLWDLPLVRTPKLDSAEYVSWALRLAAGDGAWPVVAQHGPGYPFFLAALFAISDGSIKFALFVQALIGAGTASGVATIGRRLCGVRAGWMTGVIYAIYGPVVLVETSLLGEGLLLFLLVMAIMCLTSADGAGRPHAEGASARQAAICGGLIGFAVLVRPTALSVVLAVIVWLAIWRRRSSEPGRFGQFRSLVAFGAAVMLVIAPVLLKTWSGSGSPSIQGYGGLNFYIGNSPLHDGRATFRLGAGWDALNSEAPRAGISDPAAQDRYYLSKTRQEIGQYPGRFFRLLASKSLWLVQAEESRDSHAYYFFTSQSAFLRALPGFGFVFPLACVGIVAVAIGASGQAGGDRMPGGTALLALYTVASAASVVLLVVGFRYRMPLVPALAVAAGAGLSAVATAVAKRRAKEAAGYAAAAVLAIEASQVVHDARNTNVAEEWALTGSALVTEHRLTDAEAAYRRALNLDPGLGLAWDGLGLTLYNSGRLSDAKPAFERALEIDPDNSRATFHLALVRERNDELDLAAAGYARALSLSPFDAEVRKDLAEVTRKLAVKLGMSGRTAEARDAMQRAVELAPDNGEAWIDLCLLSLDLGDRNRAAEALQRGRERGASADRVAFAAAALAR
jgi:tetratricopeptide (TPR) repeat protein